MSRISSLDSPFLLGFEPLEHLVDRVTRSAGDGYPPYNIEKTGERGLRITLAVAGFEEQALSVSTENRQLVIVGHQEEDPSRDFLHRGIAARKFRRVFVLADGVTVTQAELKDGLLRIELVQPELPQGIVKINISSPDRPGQNVLDE